MNRGIGELKKKILPLRNKKDMVEVPAEAKKGMEFVFVKKADDVLKHSLQKVEQAD